MVFISRLKGPIQCLSGAVFVQKAVLLWVLDPEERDAVLVYDSVRKWSPGNRALIEIACTRSSEELLAARRAYLARYKRSIEEDVAVHSKGDFKKVTVFHFSPCIIFALYGYINLFNLLSNETFFTAIHAS